MSGRVVLGLIRSIHRVHEAEILKLSSRLPATLYQGLAAVQGPQVSVSFHSAAVTASRTDSEKQVDEINRLFAEAREELEGAREDQGTRYFNESATLAKEAVDETLGQWDALLQQLPDAEKQALNRSMGLKMEQLKAEVKELHHLHDDD